MRTFRTGPTTPRLRLRAMTPDDAEAFFALNGDPEVMRYTGEPRLESVEAARAALAAYPDFDRVGFGRWGCELRASGELIGFCGLKYLEDLDEVDLGYRLRPAYWGRGLATEAATATLQFGVDVIGLTRIIALVLPENSRSIRVLDKIGMTRDGEADCRGLGALRYVYAAPSRPGRSPA